MNSRRLNKPEGVESSMRARIGGAAEVTGAQRRDCHPDRSEGSVIFDL
jgi:hypothetical protein